MEENPTGMSRERLLVIIAVVAAVVLTTVFLVIWQPDMKDAGQQPSTTSTATPTAEATTGTDGEADESEDDVDGTIGTTVLPEAMNGQEAIDALGDRIGEVAKRNGRTVEELKDLLLRDETVYVSKTGFIVFRDDFGGDG